VRVDGKKARASGKDTLFSCRTAPLKPKEGLNGPPASRPAELVERRDFTDLAMQSVHNHLTATS
jgi:hypothetical protein